MNNRRLTLEYILVLLSLIFVVPAVNAEDVVLYPGYISGSFSVNGFTPTGSSISAYGNGYSASKGSSGDTYSLTVQGGDWDYSVNASTYFTDPVSYYPYSYMYFKARTMRVPVGETVTNNYVVDPGKLRFQLTINGDPYTYWYTYMYAYQYQSDGEQTYSQGYNYSYYDADGIWDMPVVANQQIYVYGYVYVDNKYYQVAAGYYDVAAGQTVVIPVEITHTGQSQSSAYGALQGAVQLGNVDTLNYHVVQGGGDYAYVYDNPGMYYLDAVNTGSQYFSVYSYFNNYRSYLQWPYINGDYSNNYINIEQGQLYTKDFVQDTGTLHGEVKLTGTLLNAVPYYLSLYATGVSSVYDPALRQYVGQPTAGGYAGTTLYESDADRTYRLHLTPGPWAPYNLYMSDYNYDSGFYASNSLQVVDYNRYYDGGYYDFGQNANVVAGQSLVRNWDICTGSLSIRFRIAGGGTLNSPSVSGSSYHYTPDGKYDKYAYVSGYSGSYGVEAPVVTVHGPDGSYNFSVSASAPDGSNITFGNIATTLECGVRKGLDPDGPTITMSSPAAGSMTNAQSVMVSGTATDKSGVAAITVNGYSASVISTGNPDDPNEVAFSYDLPVANGTNEISVVATDTLGNQASNSRDITVDRWLPSVSISSPVDGSFLPASGANIPVTVSGADQGYGFKLSVYLDGALLDEVQGASDVAAPATVDYSGFIGQLAPGTHVVSATVTDIAGNSATAATTVVTYLTAEVTAKPEARHNALEGTSTIFVQLPYGLTRYASLSASDNREISASPAQHPSDVRYSADGDKLILKFSRTPELMADGYYEVEGKYCPNASNPSECYTWRGSDTTNW